MKAPNIKSANAIFITRNKLFLRNGLVLAKRTRASKFPAVIRTEDKIRALHSAIPSDLEGRLLVNEDAFSKVLFPADESIIINLWLDELWYVFSE